MEVLGTVVDVGVVATIASAFDQKATSWRENHTTQFGRSITRLGCGLAGPSPSRTLRLGEAAMRGIPNQDTLETIFPPIADYAFLSDCENSCLIAPTGAVEWLCIPEPHDPSVFGTILDRAAGSFRLAPVDSAVPAHRQYVPGTMVLATTWQTRSGWLIVNDFLADRAVVPHRRAFDPPPPHARATSTRSTSWCEPRPAYTAASTSCSTASRRSTTAASTPSGSTRARPTTR